jgi:hypothetical protein
MGIIVRTMRSITAARYRRGSTRFTLNTVVPDFFSQQPPTLGASFLIACQISAGAKHRICPALDFISQPLEQLNRTKPKIETELGRH